MKEFQLIEKYFKPLTNNCEAAQNLCDDTAKIILESNEELVISKDLMVENVHFLLTDGGFKIATKLLRSNISDLASSGAKPLYYMLGFCKNNKTDKKFLNDFSRGLRKTQQEFGLSLIGGDTVKSDKLVFSLTVFGSRKKGKFLNRNQAKEGDLIFVSGSIGDAFIYRVIAQIEKNKNCQNSISLSSQKFLQNRHFFPTPRIDLGQQLLDKNLSQCATDISDGLVADLTHICKSSKLCAELKLSDIPLSTAARQFLQKNSQIKITDLISGGDDYELIFAVNPKNLKKISQLSQALKLDLTCVGKFKKTSKNKFFVELRDDKNHKITIEKTGYEH